MKRKKERENTTEQLLLLTHNANRPPGRQVKVHAYNPDHHHHHNSQIYAPAQMSLAQQESKAWKLLFSLDSFNEVARSVGHVIWLWDP